MIALKPGTRVLGVRPEMLLALLIADGAYRDVGCDAVITSAIDGTHSRASEHYTGLAVDFRLHDVPVERRAALVARIAWALGPDYDVLHEGAGTPNEHLHVEYDPKEPY